MEFLSVCTWIKKTCLLQNSMGKVHILRVVNFGLFSHTDINRAEALLQHTQQSRSNDPIQQRLNMNFSRDEESPKVSRTRKAGKHINTPWQDKDSCVDYMGSSAMTGLWMLYTPHTFHGSSSQPWLLALGEMKNKFPLKAQKTGALNSRENFMLVKVKKKTQNLLMTTPHI